MAKGVLGNDPFQRGAASRPGLPTPASTPSQAGEPSSLPAPPSAPAPVARAAAPAGSAGSPKQGAAPAAKAPAAAAQQPSRTKAKKPGAAGKAPAAAPAAAQQAPATAKAPPAAAQQPAKSKSPRPPAKRAPGAPGNAPGRKTAAPALSTGPELSGPMGAGAAPSGRNPATGLPAAAFEPERGDGGRSSGAPTDEHALRLSSEGAEPESSPRLASASEPAWAERATGAFNLAREVLGQTLRSDTLEQLLAAAEGMVRAVRTGIGSASTSEVDAYGKDPFLERQLLPVADFLYDRYWRVSVEGAALVPQGACLLVANHSGAMPFDGPMLRQSLIRERPDLAEARWLVEDQVFHAPFLGTIFNRLGAVRACPENALRLLGERRPVIVFPEGVQGMGKPFAERYQLKRLGRGGFAKLAVRARAPIVPVAIVGAEEAFPLLAKLPGRALGVPYIPVTTPPLPSKWSIRFGDPIDTSHLAADAGEDEGEIHKLVEASRSSIEGMLSALLKQRRSVFSG